MTRQQITVKPSEKGSAIVTVTPTDENGLELEISDLTSPAYQLMMIDGTVVNEKTFTNCPLTALTFTLTGDDLAIFDSEDNGWRVLAFKALYDSDAGNDLVLKEECEFEIDRILSEDDDEAS